MPTEEERASEYRRKMTARAAWEHQQRFSALPGDDEVRAELKTNWGPIADKIFGWDPPPGGEGSGSFQRTPLGPRRIGEGRQLA